MAKIIYKPLKTAACFLLIISATACSQIDKPVPAGLYRGMTDQSPEGTPAFKTGWKAGCESGLAANGPLHYKARYDFNYDDEQIDNNEYFAAWRIGFRHCRWYIQEWQKWN